MQLHRLEDSAKLASAASTLLVAADTRLKVLEFDVDTSLLQLYWTAIATVLAFAFEGRWL